MDTSELTSSVQEMMAEMVAMRAELNELKRRASVITPPIPPQPAQEARLVVSTTRRKVLRRLAGGLLAGVAVGTIASAAPETAQASFVRSGGAGAIVMRPGGTLTGSLPATTFYGLIATPDSNLNIGGYTAGYTAGVLGTNAGTTQSFGLFGQSGDTGVYGFGGNFGVKGLTTSGHGVRGESTDSSGVSGFSTNGSGVYGHSVLYYSGYFDGLVYVGGRLDKPAGSFKIDHPLDPANKYLYHSFVESPDMMNIYNGIVTIDNQGEATITLPDWFEALNSEFRYQLTALDSASPDLHIAQRLKDRKFKIAGGAPGQEVSCMITGIRQDAWAKANRIPIEEDKNNKEKGLYLHPELFGQSKEKSISSLLVK